MRANRRGLLIQSGLELISKYGYRDVSIEDIVSHCGLSVGTFYRYFSSKESYYEQILSLIAREGTRRAERLISRLHSPMNKLRVMYHFIVIGVKNYPILRGVLLNDPRYLYPGIDLKSGTVGRLRRRIEQTVEEIIREGARRGAFRPGLYANSTRMVLMLLDMVVRSLDSPQIEEIIADTLVLLQRGIRRVIHLRHRDERLDRRLLRAEEEADWLE